MSKLHQLRRFVTLLTGVVLLGYGVWSAYFSYRQGNNLLGTVALSGALLTLGVGLLRNWFWPRRIVAALCLVVAVFAPIGYINPLNAMDLPNSPSISSILMWMVPLVSSLVLVAWLIDPVREKQPNQPLHHDASGGLTAAVVAGERRR